MLLNQFLEHYDESKAQAKIRDFLSQRTQEPERAEFLGHFLRSEFQPIVEQQEGNFHTIGFEAFVRPVAGRKTVSPITYFENMKDDDRSFVDQLSRELHVTNFLKSALPTDQLSLNVSPTALEAQVDKFDNLTLQIRTAQTLGLEPSRINVELPVSPELDPGIVYTFSSQLKSLGLKITLENFDADQASFSRIVFIRPDIVKFNRSWLDADLSNPNYCAMVRRIIDSLNALGSESHLERIETEQEVEFAMDCGFGRLQGFYVGSPSEKLSYPSIGGRYNRSGFSRATPL